MKYKNLIYLGLILFHINPHACQPHKHARPGAQFDAIPGAVGITYTTEPTTYDPSSSTTKVIASTPGLNRNTVNTPITISTTVTDTTTTSASSTTSRIALSTLGLTSSTTTTISSAATTTTSVQPPSSPSSSISQSPSSSTISSTTVSTTVSVSVSVDSISSTKSDHSVTSAAAAASDKPDDNLKKIIALAVAIPLGIILLTAILLVAFCYCRRRNKGQDAPDSRISNIPLEEGKIKQKNAKMTSGVVNVPLLPDNPIQRSDLLQYVKERENDSSKYRDEFNRLPGSGVKPGNVGRNQQDKNRYINIYPYDDNRVILQTKAKSKSDYINASYIDGYKDQKAYIAAQGPMDETVEDFWRMIWEQGCSRVVMVTNNVEGDKIKCAQYWPNKEQPKETSYGSFAVKTLKEKSYSEYDIRVISLGQGDESRDIYQFHFTDWPDQDVPDTCTALIKFYRISFLPNDSYPLKGPLVVHCSAGVGRTGTLIALDILIHQAKDKEIIDIPKCVEKLRMQRVNMVQSTVQYILLHHALLEYLLLGSVGKKSADYQRYYNDLVRAEEKDGISLMSQQLEVLNAIKPKFFGYQYSLAKTESNQSKNRTSKLLPMDNFIPRLRLPGESIDSYINAVCVRSYSSQPHIATQMPLPHTCAEFWTLVFDYHSAAIVMLNNLNNERQYWPEDGRTVTVADMVITNTGEITDDNIHVIDLKIIRAKRYSKSSPRPRPRSIEPPNSTMNSLEAGSAHLNTLTPPSSDLDDCSRKVRMIRVLDWDEGRPFPRDPSTLLDVYTEVERCRKKVKDGRVLVHCLFQILGLKGLTILILMGRKATKQVQYGAERTGVFCALMNALDELNQNKTVDVFNSVKRVRRSRPEFITNKDQYRYLHDLIQQYFRTSERL